MNYPWFKKYGWFFLPVSPAGWVVTILFVIFCIHIFIAVDVHSHSVSDTLYGVFPFKVPAFFVWQWIGWNTSGKKA